MRTGTYVPFARSVACWGGVGPAHDPEADLHVIDVDRRLVREVAQAARLAGQAGQVGPRGAPPAARGGAVAACVSPFGAVMLCGSDHADGGEMLAPHVLRLVLPGCR